ncbi:MAG TPA: hypothetical protein VM715_01585, partial [Candidatus Acidoferrum sp.]|nr:hypothetical protein [Candidatus Acidoferrum sp.]
LALRDESSEAASDGSNGEHRAPERYANELWLLGWTDGRLGKSHQFQEAVVTAHTALLREQLRRQANHSYVSAEARHSTAETLAGLRSQEWETVQRDFDELTAAQRENPSMFSKQVGFVFLLFGLLVFIADMPFAFIAAGAVKIATQATVPGSNGATVSVTNLDQLFRYAGLLWQPIAFALGLAGLTVMFKVFADAVQKWQREPNPWLKTLAWLFLGVAFLSVISTFILVGIVRGQTVAGIVSPYSIALFTLLGIIFPFVAGFCFSIAKATIQNAARFRSLQEVRSDLWAKYIAARENLERAKAAVTQAIAEQEVVDTTIFQNIATAVYLHGYARGRCAPETLYDSEGLYDRARRQIIRWVAMIPQLENGR